MDCGFRFRSDETAALLSSRVVIGNPALSKRELEHKSCGKQATTHAIDMFVPATIVSFSLQ